MAKKESAPMFLESMAELGRYVRAGKCPTTTVRFQVFGTYTHGAKKGQTNPKESVELTLHETQDFRQRNKNGQVTGRIIHPRLWLPNSLKALKARLSSDEFGSPFYKILEVSEAF